MATEEQVNARVDPALKAEYAAIAAALDVTGSVLFREVLEGALPAMRERELEAVKKRAGFPGAIPPDLIRDEIQNLIKSVSDSRPLSVLPRELFGARGLALQAFLNWVLPTDKPSLADKKAHDKLAHWLESLDIKASVAATPSPTPAVLPAPAPAVVPTSKPVKNYPRR